MVENAFNILKKNFSQLLHNLDLSVTFLLDVFTYCCLLHNLLRIEDKTSIKHLPINIPQDETINQRLNGEERSKDILRQ
jgi:hypothetical protein